MFDYQSWSDFLLSESSTTSRSEIVPSKVISRNIHHELSGDLEARSIEDEFWVAPSSSPTAVRVKSSVSVDAARAFRSPEYMATIRRRKAKKIETLLHELEPNLGKDDLHVYTHAVLQEVRSAIAALVQCDEEGNSSEVFRVIRDSLMNGMHENYRRAEVRELVLKYLRDLKSSEKVESDTALAAGDEFDDLGLLDYPQLFGDVEIEETEASS